MQGFAGKKLESRLLVVGGEPSVVPFEACTNSVAA